MAYSRLSAASEEEVRSLLKNVVQDAHDNLAERLLTILRRMDVENPPYPITRYQHSLQSGSRALNDRREEEYVVAALLHDIGDELAPFSHGEYCAAILRPYVAERIYWIIQNHPIFDLFHYGLKVGLDRNARDQFRGHPWYKDAVEFCAKYDQNCFDPSYKALPLEVFVPMVKRVFAEPRYRTAETATVLD
jgi:predicted HD phosphohydrolase